MSPRSRLVLAAPLLVACAREVIPAWDDAAIALDASPDASPAPRVAQIATAPSHTCVLLQDTSVRCFGDNRWGELGTGDVVDRLAPAHVSGLSGVRAIAAGGIHSTLYADPAGSASATCAILADSTVSCWGTGHVTLRHAPSPDELEHPSPTPVDGLTNVEQIVVGGAFACALDTSGNVSCWGVNAYQTLGDGTTAPHYMPARVAGMPPATELSAGSSAVCALARDGSVYCWGALVPGALGGVPLGTPGANATPTRIGGLANVTHIAVGLFHACALRSDGTVQCWGNNDRGQLGTTHPAPGVLRQVDGVANATAIGAGGMHTCALLADGTMRCWGSDSYGECGVAPNPRAMIPNAVAARNPGLHDVRAISVGESHTCALEGDGSVQCFGIAASGALGDGARSDLAQPMARAVDFASHDRSAPVPTLAAPSHVAAGRAIACAVTDAGTVRCWGSNLHGQLGDGTLEDRFSPVEVAGLDHVVQVAAGGFNNVGSTQLGLDASHVCAVRDDGGVVCWGENRSGQLGDGTTTNRLSPVPVHGITHVAEVVASGDVTCARNAGGEVWCWGDTGDGVVGPARQGDPQSTPVHIAAAGTVRALAAGLSHVCAIDADGAIECWGDNSSGQLGDGTHRASSAPVHPALPAHAVSVSAGDRHSCAVLENGTVWCWGADEGQLGSASAMGNGPLQVTGIDDAVSVHAGGNTACARRRDGRVQCWGALAWDPVLVDHVPTALEPMTIDAFQGATEVSVGEYVLCALRADATIVCTGFNWFGAVGDGTRTSRLSPVPVRW